MAPIQNPSKTLSSYLRTTFSTIFRVVREGWGSFWFRSPAPQQMRAFRVAISWVMFFSVMMRTMDLRFFYSDQGMFRQSILPELMDMSYRHSFFELFHGMAAVWVCHIALLISLALLAFGIFPRVAALVALALHLSFLHRNVAVAYGVDLISTYYLFYLCFADYRPLGQMDQKESMDARRIVGSMSYRLCQIQVCLIYVFAGLDKIKGPAWWRGDALWLIFASSQRATLDLTWTSHFPAALAFMTYLTLFWEVYFPVLVWFKPAGRWISIGLGVFIHIGIAVTMGLFTFSSLMVSMYLLFIGEENVDKIAQCVKNLVIHRKVFWQRTEEISV